jgi:hypothetical protein
MQEHEGTVGLRLEYVEGKIVDLHIVAGDPGKDNA